MRGLNRKTFDLILGQTASDDLFSYVSQHTGKRVAIAYDPLLREYYNFNDSEAVVDADEGTYGEKLIVAIKGMHSRSYSGVRCFSVPFAFLKQPSSGNWLYRITFGPGSDAARETLDHPSFSPFRSGKGYIGLTSRPNPLTRFNEHWQKARSGTGHLLHKAWRALSDTTEVTVQFSVVGMPLSRQRAFELEEQLVDELGTVAPGGLNVIAGGMKGIREMWRLGLMARGDKPTDANREAALALLESERSPVSAHYRTGHIRRLPDRCAMRTTWVSPCWVGMKAPNE